MRCCRGWQKYTVRLLADADRISHHRRGLFVEIVEAHFVDIDDDAAVRRIGQQMRGRQHDLALAGKPGIDAGLAAVSAT